MNPDLLSHTQYLYWFPPFRLLSERANLEGRTYEGP